MQKSGSLPRNTSTSNSNIINTTSPLRVITPQRRLGLCSQIATGGQHSSPIVFPEKRRQSRRTTTITNNLSGVPTPADDPVKPKTFEHRIDIGLGGPAASAAAAGGDEKSDLLGYVVFSGKLVWDKRKTSNNNATDVQQTSNTDVTGQVAIDAKLTSRALVWGSHMLALDDVISVSSFFHAHCMLPTRKTKNVSFHIWPLSCRTQILLFFVSLTGFL